MRMDTVQGVYASANDNCYIPNKNFFINTSKYLNI